MLYNRFWKGCLCILEICTTLFSEYPGQCPKLPFCIAFFANGFAGPLAKMALKSLSVFIPSSLFSFASSSDDSDDPLRGPTTR